MSKVNLKNILSPKYHLFEILESLIKEFNGQVFIEDNFQKVVIGTAFGNFAVSEPVKNEDEIIGWVKGNDKALIISSIINIWVIKELEKKKLGHEILVLYQDVNQMFNFSEQLAQSIGQNSIAAITLDEAGRLIKLSNGVMMLWDDGKMKMDIVATSGNPVFQQEKLLAATDLLLSIFRTGQSDIIGDLSVLKEKGLVIPEVQALMYASLKVKHRVMGTIVLASTEPIQYSAADLKFLVTIALQSASAIESAFLYEKNIREAKEREEAMRHIYEVANKFVPHEFIKSLGRKVITDIQLGDQVEKIVTVLFSDIRGYTTIAEKMTPEENFQFICSFNERIGPIIRAHNGFINQYLGDAIMAIFPGSPSDALAAAIDMQKAVKELNEVRQLMDMAPIQIGVGMHTGPLIMGITGDRDRLDATTIADTVNTASRLESLTKHYHVNILLGEASVDNLNEPGKYHIRHLGSVQLKGKIKPVSIFECFSGSEDDVIQKKLETLPVFQRGMGNYYNKLFDEASVEFLNVLAIDPRDNTTKHFLDKAIQYKENGISSTWTGVEEMQFK